MPSPERFEGKQALFRRRPIAHRSKTYINVRCTEVEKRLWFEAAGGYSLSELVRNLLNEHIGYTPPAIRQRQVLGRPPKRASVSAGSHCGYSGLPKADCLCDLCVKGRA